MNCELVSTSEKSDTDTTQTFPPSRPAGLDIWVGGLETRSAEGAEVARHGISEASGEKKCFLKNKL